MTPWHLQITVMTAMRLWIQRCLMRQEHFSTPLNDIPLL
jgi:hypothetical protein